MTAIWQLAIADGAPGNALATLELSGHDHRWTFSIVDEARGISFHREYPDDAAACPTGVLPSSADTVRAPVAADLAEYTKGLVVEQTEGDELLAEIATSEGTFHCELYRKAAMTVANFIGLATGKKAWKDPRSGETVTGTPYFDGLTFHRVVKGFLIQGGDPLGDGTGGPGYTMDLETYPDLVHEPGTLSMASTGRAHTSGGQFFISVSRFQDLDGAHSVFGKCKEVDLVKRIAARQRPGTELPSAPVTIEKVTISTGK